MDITALPKLCELTRIALTALTCSWRIPGSALSRSAEASAFVRAPARLYTGAVQRVEGSIGIRVDYGLKVAAITFHHVGQGRTDQSALPCGPDGIRDHREDSAQRGIDCAGGDDFPGSDSRQRHQKNDERTERRDKDTVIGRPDQPHNYDKAGEQSNVRSHAGVNKVKQDGSEQQSRECSRQTLYATAEGAGKVRFQNQRDRHG